MKKDLLNSEKVSAYFSDASQNFPMTKQVTLPKGVGVQNLTSLNI